MSRNSIRKILINIILLILAFTIQICVFPQIGFLSAAPNLLLILVFTNGFIDGKGAGICYGLVAGLFMDLFYSGPFGFYTLFFINVGYINGVFTKYYYEDYITLPLILSITNDLAYNMYIYVFRFLIRARLDFLYYFKEIMIPEIIFTTASSSRGVSLLPSRVRVIWTAPQNLALSLNFFAISSNSFSNGTSGSKITVIPAWLPLITTVLCILRVISHLFCLIAAAFRLAADILPFYPILR